MRSTKISSTVLVLAGLCGMMISTTSFARQDTFVEFREPKNEQKSVQLTAQNQDQSSAVRAPAQAAKQEVQNKDQSVPLSERAERNLSRMR